MKRSSTPGRRFQRATPRLSADPRLRSTLAELVPEAVRLLRRHGRPHEGDRRCAAIWMESMQSRGDVLLQVAQDRGELANFLDLLILSIGVAACEPGGVELFGLRFVADGADCAVSLVSEGEPCPERSG